MPVADTMELSKDSKNFSKPLTDVEKRRQISVRGISSFEGVNDLKKVSINLLLQQTCFYSIDFYDY